MASFIVILLLYLMMIFAECIAPYSPTTAFPELTYHPPNLRLAGGIKAQEARITNTISWKYTAIRGLYVPVKFFAKGEPYRLWGIVSMDRHLFTTGYVDTTYGDMEGSYPIFLMGADSLGRDLFSRIVYGSQIGRAHV